MASEGFGLYDYMFEVPTDDEQSTEQVEVNEFDNLVHMLTTFTPPQCKAGVRISNMKFYPV